MQLLRQTGWMIVRQLRNLMREPIWIALMIIQPLIWLLLYGQLFSRVGALRGGASSYIEFLTPGIVCMNAFFGGSWSGMAMISDLNRHVIDRFLAAPASRFAIVLSQVVRAGITAVIQALILLLLGLALGVRVHGGVAGWFVVFAAAALLAMTFAGFSHGIALLVRKEASMIAAANFVGLPLMFISAILIPPRQMPHWIALTPNGHTAYVTNEKDNDLSVVDLATHKVTATIPLGQAPRKIVIQPAPSPRRRPPPSRPIHRS